MIDNGEPANAACSMAKCFAGDMVVAQTANAVQIFGGSGYIRGFEVERLYRDAKICQIYEGTQQIQRTVIARELLKNGARIERLRALVTGASRGIGKGIALALASRGFSIAVNALVHDGEVEETLAELRRGGVKATAAIGDISDISNHESILDNAELGVGDLTTLVNNAGVSVLQRGDLLDVTPESYDRCEAVNARGTFS